MSVVATCCQLNSSTSVDADLIEVWVQGTAFQMGAQILPREGAFWGRNWA